MMRLNLKLKKFFLETDGQAMTEYVLTLVLITLLTIPALKLIPRAFGLAFDRIISFHSCHMDDLLKAVKQYAVSLMDDIFN